jgi:hypothetical protein
MRDGGWFEVSDMIEVSREAKFERKRVGGLLDVGMAGEVAGPSCGDAGITGVPSIHSTSEDDEREPRVGDDGECERG